MIEDIGAISSKGVRSIPHPVVVAPPLLGWLNALVRNRGLAAYIAAVSLAGAACFFYSLEHLTADTVPALVALIVLAVVFERIHLPLADGGELISSTMVYAAGIILLPAPAVIVLAFVATLIGELLARKTWFKIAFNVGQSTLSRGAAALIWLVVSGEAHDISTLLDDMEGAFLAIGVNYVVNTSLVSGVLTLAGGGGLWERWRQNFFGVLLPHFGMQVLGLLFAAAWLLDWRALLLLSVPAGITWTSARHIRALEGKAEVERQLRDRSEALAARWEALAQIGERLSTTVDPKELAEIAANVAIRHCADAACVVAPGAGVATAVRPGSAPQLRARLAASVATLDGYVASGVRALPLRVGDQEVGTLYAAWDSGEPSPDQDALLEPLADRIAIALQNTLLSAQAGEVEALREIDRMKGDLLASVSHELKTPIALMVGYGELLEKRTLEHEQTRWMGGKILSAGRHLTRLVDDLLDAGRLESGRFTLDRRLLDLRAVAESAIETARVAHAGPRFVADLPRSPVVVEGDQSRLLQVMTNLLSNAARYGPGDGEIRLTIEPNGVHAIVGVADEGPGVPPAERERIFEKFYRAPGADRRSRKGLGLGLTIVRDLVAAHGGRVRVEDAPKRGARFVVELPRLETRA